MTARDALRQLTPPLLVSLVRRLRPAAPADPCGFSGDYANWAEASAASTGYDDEAILEKTRVALLAVKSGAAVYERDSVLFDEIEYAWPTLAGLLLAAARSGGELNVLDFGGSLGSTYFQNRALLEGLPTVRWNIVEQPRHVEVGREWFEDDCLRFYASIADCLAETKPNVVLLGSVLQYLEHPYVLLDEVLALSCRQIIIDRTPFWDGPIDRLCVQTVPPTIYTASYPSWIFSRQGFRSRLTGASRCILPFDNLHMLQSPLEGAFEGVIVDRGDSHGA